MEEEKESKHSRKNQDEKSGKLSSKKEKERIPLPNYLIIFRRKPQDKSSEK